MRNVAEKEDEEDVTVEEKDSLNNGESLDKLKHTPFFLPKRRRKEDEEDVEVTNENTDEKVLKITNIHHSYSQNDAKIKRKMLKQQLVLNLKMRTFLYYWLKRKIKKITNPKTKSQHQKILLKR